MPAGGIYDQVGGGFARYSVDAAWLVPHFEKMLYDNALLARAYLHGWQRLGHERYRRACEETLDWALREMRGPEGGFYSALDADTEGEEGRFYVWTPDQVREVLGDGAQEVDRLLRGHRERQLRGHGTSSTSPAGSRPPSPRASTERAAPSTRRAPKRIWPGLDDKRLTAWNALMIAALAEAGAVLERDDYLDAARACADFVWSELRDTDGNLLRTYKDGNARLNAYLEDHAFLLEALLSLYEASFECIWFERARDLAETLLARFADAERGGFFSTSDNHESLIARRKEIGDHPIPSGNSAAAFGLLRLAALSGERSYELAAEGVFRLFSSPPAATPRPSATCSGRSTSTSRRPRRWRWSATTCRSAAVVRAELRPHLVLAGGPEGSAPCPSCCATGPTIDGAPAAYVAEDFACRQPSPQAGALTDLLWT